MLSSDKSIFSISYPPSDQTATLKQVARLEALCRVHTGVLQFGNSVLAAQYARGFHAGYPYFPTGFCISDAFSESAPKSPACCIFSTILENSPQMHALIEVYKKHEQLTTALHTHAAAKRRHL